MLSYVDVVLMQGYRGAYKNASNSSERCDGLILANVDNPHFCCFLPRFFAQLALNKARSDARQSIWRHEHLGLNSRALGVSLSFL